VRPRPLAGRALDTESVRTKFAQSDFDGSALRGREGPRRDLYSHIGFIRIALKQPALTVIPELPLA